jgi:SAM-dependent methyltransferase
MAVRSHWKPSLRRSFRLLSAFRWERTDPDRFYRPLAADTADMLASLYRTATGRDAAGATVLDVGGGPGYFAPEFHRHGMRYLAVDVDPTAGAVRGCAMALPVRADAVDICLSSNVAEHVPRPWAMAAEMLRVLRPGGIAVLSYTVWSGPFGGHETGLWHWIGGEYAANRYQRREGRSPKNRFGETLFPIRAADGLRWVRRVREEKLDGLLVAAFPRYHPRWAWWIVRVPWLRELMVCNLVLVIRKGQVSDGDSGVGHRWNEDRRGSDHRRGSGVGRSLHHGARTRSLGRDSDTVAGGGGW